MGSGKKDRDSAIEVVVGENDEVSLYARIAPDGITAEEAAALQEQFLGLLELDDRSGAMNAAHQMLVGGLHEECIQLYLRLAKTYPDDAGDCYGAIGAAHYFLGEFERAISFYEEAKAHGADERMMDENIEEARQALAAN